MTGILMAQLIGCATECDSATSTDVTVTVQQVDCTGQVINIDVTGRVDDSGYRSFESCLEYVKDANGYTVGAYLSDCCPEGWTLLAATTAPSGVQSVLCQEQCDTDTAS